MPSVLSPSVQKTLEKCGRRGLLGALMAAARELIDQDDALKAACKKGRTSRTVSGVKKKGREGVQMARSWLLRLFFDLEPDDILIQTTSVGGSDLHFSPKAAKLFPFAPESKRVQSLNIWGALHQAEVNAKKKGQRPVLFFSRSAKGSEVKPTLYVAFKAADLHAWLHERHTANVSNPDKDIDGSNGSGSRDQVTPEAG